MLSDRLKSNRRGRANFAVVAALITFCLAPSFGQPPQKSNARGIQSPDKEMVRLSPESRARVRQAIAAVGLLLVRNGGDDPEPRPRGSGVIVRRDGLIVTNYHVINIAKSNRVYDEIFFAPSGNLQPDSPSIYRLKPLLSDKDNDLALLRIEADRDGRALPQPTIFPTIEIGDSRGIELLEDLIIVGFPEKGGTTVTLSTGVVEGKDPIRNWIKTDARLIHGNSGGAAVDSDGKLIGIPTKVEADVQPIDRNGDGSPDSYRRFGAVGFLRPAYLVTGMIAELDNPNFSQTPDRTMQSLPAPNASPPKSAAIKPPAPRPSSPDDVVVSGFVRSQPNSKPVAGALVGIVPIGTMKVTEENLLAWGNTNQSGEFKLNNPIPPGKYILRASAIGRAPYSRELEVTRNMGQLIIELRGTTGN